MMVGIVVLVVIVLTSVVPVFVKIVVVCFDSLAHSILSLV